MMEKIMESNKMKKVSAPVKLLLFSGSLLLAAGCTCDKPAECKTAEVPQVQEPAVWPDRDWLRKSVIAGIPAILDRFDPKTGEIGDKPWICQDQNEIFTLAVAWGTPGKDNPYYHSPELLNVIAKAGEKLVDAQDEKGMWTFRKKDNSTWGQIHMPWTYTRWIRAYYIVKDALPPASKAKWEKGLLLGYKYISQFCSGTGTHNITVYHAAGLYVAGLAFDKPEWCRISRRLMHLLVSRQAADGYWTEHFGPVVSYNFVYLEALGIYHHYSKDPVAKQALAKGAQFHAALLWPDGSAVSVVDERNHYSHNRRVGNVGFSCSPEGRRYLLQQLDRNIKYNRNVSAEFAAIMLLESDSGKAAPLPEKESSYVSNDGNFSVSRSAPFQWAMSAYACKAPGNRWIMDRQTHVEIGHDKLGVIGSGGNTKMQPYFSTFTFGDPASFQPDYTTKKPVLHPKSNIQYVPEKAVLNGNTVQLTYGQNQCSVTVRPQGETLTLEYKLLNTPDKAAMAHFPVIVTSSLRDGNDKTLKDNAVYSGKDLANKLCYQNGLVITLPDDAVIRPRVIGFNPYDAYGKGDGVRLVISLPFSGGKTVQNLTFSVREKDSLLADAECIPAEVLPVKSNGFTTKLVEEVDTVFMRASRPGAEFTFTLKRPRKEVRELYLDLLRSYTYGTVQILINGKEMGKPVCTYSAAVAITDPVAVGKVELQKGENTITIRVVGKHPDSSNYFAGLRSVYLK